MRRRRRPRRRSPPVGPVAAMLAGALAASGCDSFAPPPPDLERLLAEAALSPGPCVRQRATLHLESASLNGRFTAVLAADIGAALVRLQLFPDVGGKILDVVASPHVVAGVMPPAGILYEAQPPQAGELHPILLFGITLLEHFTPLSPGRVIGARRAGDVHQLLLAPRVPGVEVVAVVHQDGPLLSRRYAFRGASWSEVLGPELVVAGKGFELVVADVQTKVERELSPSLFRLPEAHAEARQGGPSASASAAAPTAPPAAAAQW